MALDKTALSDAFKTAFRQGMDNPAWTKEDAADALADAIDAYVRGAEVVGVAVDVVDLASNPSGTGTQTGTGSLQ